MSSGNEYDFDVGLGLLLAFHVYARGAEIDGLQTSHVVLGNDLRSLAGRTQVFFVTTKAGRPQAVTVDNALGLAVIHVALRRARRRRSAINKDPTLFDFGPGGFMQRFKRIQRQCGYLMAIFVRHSCRHGGATNDFSRQLRAVVEVSQRLRHADTKTTQAYLQDTQAHLLMQKVPRDTTTLVKKFGGEVGLTKLLMQLLGATTATRQ
jgi:integrase